jgi:hypothetical protein
MKLFVDDQWELPMRFPGPGWSFVRSVAEAKLVLTANQGKITHLSLDSDLASDDGLDGPDLTAWLSEQYFINSADYWPSYSIQIHSRNGVGRAKMESDIRNPKYNPRPHLYVGG